MSHPPLVGREGELAVLTAALDDAAGGRGTVSLVAGEPGIGKTSLVGALAATASARGAIVRWGRAWEAGGAPAFWPWIEALRGLAPELEGMADLSAVHPVGQAASTRDDPGQARFLLFDAVASLLRRASAVSPLVLILDDLHAADLPTLQLLHFLSRSARSVGVALVGTFRDVEARASEEVGSLLARITREARFVRLERLDRDQVAELVAGTLGTAADAELVERLCGATEGNPLFLVEALRLVRSQGGLAEALPRASGVRDVIRQRLSALPETTIALLELLAVIGREADPALLAAAAGRSGPEVIADLAGAVALEVLVWRGEHRVAFTHILLRDVPYQGLTHARRAELHRRVAEALAGRHAGDSRAPLAELAHHLLEAAPIVDHSRVIAVARQAAAQAMDHLAFEDAVALLDRALGLLDPGSLPSVDRCDLLLALGQALVRSGQHRKGRERCRQSADEARRLGDPERLGRAALAYGEVFVFGTVDHDLHALCQEALDALGDGAVAARLLARQAAALQPARDPTGPMDLARRAIAMARRSGTDEHTLLAVLHSATSALLYFADPSERAPLNREQIELARGLGDRVRELRGHLRLVVDHVEQGDVTRAEAGILEVVRLARLTRRPALLWHVPMLRALRATMDGRFDDALGLVEEARAISARADDLNTDLAFTQFRLGFACLSTRLDEMARAEPPAREILERVTDAWYARPCLAVVAARRGLLAEARAELARLPGDLAETRDRPMSAWVAEAAALVGDVAMMERLYDTVGRFAHRNLSWGLAAMICEGPIAGVQAILAHRLGRFDESDRLFEDTLARTGAMGARPLEARARHDYGRALLERGEAARACEVLEPAREIAEAIGMTGLATALQELDVRPAARRAPEPAAPAIVVPTVAPFEMLLEGEVWTFRFEGQLFRLKDMRGLRILHELLKHAGRELHVTDLLAPAGEAGHVEDAGDVIDREAASDYRRRLEELRDELEEAERFSDPGRASRLREEMEFLADELARGLGLGGRARKASSTSEKARVNVKRRLQVALDKIAAESPRLAQHLQWALRTGTFCSYNPTGR